MLLLLAACSTTVSPTPLASHTPPPTQPPALTVTPQPDATLVATWTPQPLSTHRPSPSPWPTSQSSPAPSTSAAYWDPGELPAKTLTPTRESAVPRAAQGAYAAASDAFAVGDLDLALSHVDEALSQAPEHAGFWGLRGEILIQLLQPLEGEANLLQALGIDPFHAPSRLALAQLYASFGRWREAAAEYTRYLTLVPDDPDAWYALGQVRERQGRSIDALDAYSQTLVLAPDHVACLSNRAALWLAQENLTAAWSDLTALLALDPQPEVYQTRAEINLQLGQPLLAAADLEALLSLQSGQTSTYTLMLQIGNAYLAGLAPARAATAFSTTLSFSDTVEARLGLGESYLALGEYAAARQVYSDTLSLAPPRTQGQVLTGRARAYFGEQEFGAAITDLDEALLFARTQEEKAIMLQWRSQSYAGLGLYEEAIIDLTEIYEQTPSPLLLYQRAVWHQASGNTEEAIADLRIFIEEASPEETDPAVLEDARIRLEELAGDSS